MLSSTFSKAAVVLAACLEMTSASPMLAARQSTAPFTIEPFMQINTLLGPQNPTSNLQGGVGLFQQTGAGNFSGIVSGTIPLLELEITYAGNSTSFLTQQSYGRLNGILETTDGVPLQLEGQGPTNPIRQGQSIGVQVTGYVSLQTRDPKYTYLNGYTFLIDLCGGQVSQTTLMGMAQVYSVNSTQACSLPSPQSSTGPSTGSNETCTTSAA